MFCTVSPLALAEICCFVSIRYCRAFDW